MEQEKENIMEFSYELYKESVEPLIKYKGLRSLHLINGHPPFVRNSDGDFAPLSLEMEDDAGHTHEFHFKDISAKWFYGFLSLMLMEYFGLESDDAKALANEYMTGKRTQQIFHLDSGTLIYLRMDAGFTGSGAVLTAVPVFEPSPCIPQEAVSAVSDLPGLVLLTGCAGSGRAFTMYTLLLELLKKKPKKVSIVEEVPRYNIDFVKDSLVMRRIAFDREATYIAELSRAMTTDVDVICLDDVSDPMTLDEALKACAAGKTVFGMIGASSISEALDSVFYRCEPERREMLRYQLSTMLKAIIFQQKIPALDSSMVSAYEIVGNAGILAASYEFGKTDAHGYVSLHQESCLPFNASLARLKEAGVVSEETCAAYSIPEKTKGDE